MRETKKPTICGMLVGYIKNPVPLSMNSSYLLILQENWILWLQIKLYLQSWTNKTRKSILSRIIIIITAITLEPTNNSSSLLNSSIQKQYLQKHKLLLRWFFNLKRTASLGRGSKESKNGEIHSIKANQLRK